MATSSAKYLRFTRRRELSRNANYADAFVDYEDVEEIEPTRYNEMEVLATTGGTTVELGLFGAIDKVIVRNRDLTNYVDGTFRTAANGANDNKLRAEAGESFDTGGNVTPGNDLVLTANGADCECVVEIYGTVS